MKYDIFISYRRDGGEYTAKIIRDRLEDLGYQVFFDVESLRSGDFNTRLYSVIDECRDVLVIMSPGCLTRCAQEDDWVRRELEYALAKGKNIIPILLRGFSFPDTLPASLEAIRYKNGIEANSEFFDAFLEKLQSFLDTKPTPVYRLVKNPIFRRTLPFLLAIIIFAAGAYGISSFQEARKGIYPRTQAEKNVVSETLYYIETNLTCMNLMLKEYYSMLDACDNYLIDQSPSAYNAAVDAADNVYRQIGKTDLPAYTMTDNLSGSLGSSPFQKGELRRLEESLLNADDALMDGLSILTGDMNAQTATDNPEALWGKALRFAKIGLYEEAAECVQAYQQKVRKDDPAADLYCVSAVQFFRQISQTGIDYGVLILGPPEGESCSPYQIGDILIAINQSPCHNFEEYKVIDRSNGYEATVLRSQEDGTLLLTDLTIEAGSAPRSYMLDMTEKFD